MFDQGEILLVPVPFSDLSSVKKRPVLVLSNYNHNVSNRDIIVIAITSNLTQEGIEITNDSLIDGFLPKKSIIKVDKVYTLEVGIVIKKIGKIKNEVLLETYNEFLKLISL
ncbi:MAG: type II toxin-antitoxin system PemK/MazF family toxin [Treponema sp.]|nr:type II toxin-antitoxin system PemK/MazF family toxin [Treponema sp.]MCL2250751.1 type II toxin-antitoxin system PemK/MazF family toxin [Treponema sp.]